MKRIALFTALIGLVLFGTRQVWADESAPMPLKNAVVRSADSQGAITPVHRYVVRTGPGWYSPYYAGPGYYYSARPYYSYYSAYPWRSYYGYYGRPGYYYSGPRAYVGWGW